MVRVYTHHFFVVFHNSFFFCQQSQEDLAMSGREFRKDVMRERKKRRLKSYRREV